MTERRGKWIVTAASLLLAAVMSYVYVRYVYSAPTISWVRSGVTYEFLSPKLLGVALLFPYFLWFTGRSLADLPWPQRILSAGLRGLFVVLLAVGLARFSKTESDSHVCTVYLVDVSQSVPDEAVADARAEIEKALRGKPNDALVRVVTFAKRPRVVPLADDAKTAPELARHDLGNTGAGAGSDLESALRLAYGLYPAGMLRRAVLLTDGVQTDGDLLSESARAASYGVRLFAVPYRRPVPGEVAVRELKMPDRVRIGEPFSIRAEVFSNRAQKVRVSLKQGEALNGLDGIRDVDLKPGDNEVSFKSVVRVAGDVTYRMDVTKFEQDRFAENNHYTSTLAVPGRPTILYVEGNPSRANYLSGALSAQDFDVDVRGAREIPSSLRELERYDFFFLSDVPQESVSLTQQETIEQYVRDLGGGFLFAGGENGYALGGWSHSTMERLLPVRMDADKKRDEPQVAMALVIDRSGSMSGLPLEMAKAAAKATADTLGPEDMLEVIAFDSQPTRVVRMTAAQHRARIQTDIARIQPGGGTEIFPALDAAYQSLSQVRAKRKHVILLTDGQAPPGGIRDLTQAMAAESITVSSVGLGGGVDEGLLRMISELGGGRFYKVADPQQLPRVFTRETEMVSRNSAVEEYFQPKVVGNADFLRGVEMSSAPYLHGYVATRMKPAPAQELLQSDVGEPVLARWRVGLGWALAWTSDVKNLWAVEWLRWNGYGQFWGQLVREHMRQRRRQELSMHAHVDIATGTVKTFIDAIGTDDRFQNGLDGKLSIIGPEPGGETKGLPLRQTAPGRYEAEFALEKFGSFLLRGTLEKPAPDTKGKSVQVAEAFAQVTNPYPREYLAFEPDRVTLERATAVANGSLDAPIEKIFDPAGEKVSYHRDLWPRFIGIAIIIYLLDLFLRRVRLFDRKETARPVRA